MTIEWCQVNNYSEEECEYCYCMKQLNHDGSHKCCCGEIWKGDDV